MTTKTDLDSAIELSHTAVAAVFRGDASVASTLFSERDDVTLGNPFGPFVRGRKNVIQAVERAAANYREGELTGAELIAKHVSGELALVVEIESGRAKVGGATEFASLALRATSVFRLESGAWKVVHRHADPITTPRPATSVTTG
jgi:ketosteroid isomerase-like protein